MKVNYFLKHCIPFISAILVIFLVPVSDANAQLATGTGAFFSGEGNEMNGSSGEGIQLKNIHTPQFHVSMGTSYSNFGGAGMLSSYIAPSVKIPVNKKWDVSVGGAFFNNSLNGMSSYDIGSSVANLNGAGMFMPNSYVYTNARYQLNDKIRISGTAFKSFNLQNNGQMPRINPKAFDFTSQGMSMGINYQISNSVSFDAGVSIYQGNNPLYSPYNRSLFNMNPAGNYYPW